MPDLILEDGPSVYPDGYMRLPPGWIGVIGEPRMWKPYGWFDRRERVLEVHAPAWMPAFLRPRFHRIIWEHEALHAWGNPGCERPWCLGYEGARSAERGTRKADWGNFMEYCAMPLQLLWGLRFCEECRKWELKISR